MKFDIKFHIVALFAAMMALSAQAAPVSSEQVCGAVSAWAAANGSAFANPGYALSADAVNDSDGTVLYYKVKMSKGGLIIASSDTDLDLVVAVLENSTGDFPAGHPLPSILKKDMRRRLSIVRSAAPMSRAISSAVSLPDDVKASVAKANAQWAKYGSAGSMRMLAAVAAESGPVVTNVLRIVDGFEEGGRFTHWDQGAVDGELCYNYYTPSNVICGCVATAGAAIMQFFGNTADIGEQGAVNVDGCYLYGEPFECKTLPGAIDWSLMDNYVTQTNEVYTQLEGGSILCTTNVMVSLADEESRKLAGLVTYNLGVLSGMWWDTEVSLAYLADLAEALKAYGFTSARCVSFSAEDIGTDGYFKLIFSQNWAGAPVVLGIAGEDEDGGEVGHAVVACGYAKTSDGEELGRVFMGWGGYGDAWYRFPNVESFSIVDEVITMIGLEDDAVVPVCGHSRVPCDEFQILADGSAEPVAVAEVSSNGYFAVRIPASLETSRLRIRHDEMGKEQEITPYDSVVIGDVLADASELVGALPEEVDFLGLNMLTKMSMSVARAKALEISEANAAADPPKPGVAVLAVSGSRGERLTKLLDLICRLDSTTDMSNRFVFVRVNSKMSMSLDADGDPSIAVFDPYLSSDDLGWWSGNGRLAYSNFIDTDKDNLGELQYIIDTDPVAFTNTVLSVGDTGYDSYLRLHSGIEVSVMALGADGAALNGLGGVDKPYGVHANCWTNGEIAVFSAPEACTNETLGVAYSCAGWTTNLADIAGSVKTNRCVEIPLAFGDSVDFAWVWDVQAYRVTASVADYAVAGAVTPAEAWRVPGDRITLLAAPSISLDGGQKGFKEWWAVPVNGLETDEFDTLESTDFFENGSSLSFTVNEPLAMKAYYNDRSFAQLPAHTNAVTVSVNNRDLEDKIAELGGSLSLGENSTFDDYASVAGLISSDIVDATGGVWRCTGYVVNGVTNSVPQAEPLKLDAQSTTALELVWELQAPEANLPEPGEISIKSVAQVDGKWVVTVSGGVKDCWYWLYSSDTLSDLAGEQWSASLEENVGEANPQQALQDGDIVFTVTSSEGRMFWRAKVTATESGDQ